MKKFITLAPPRTDTTELTFPTEWLDDETEEDLGWRAYIWGPNWNHPNARELLQHPDSHYIINSPIGITWDVARDWLRPKNEKNASFQEALNNAEPHKPFTYRFHTNAYANIQGYEWINPMDFVIEKVKERNVTSADVEDTEPAQNFGFLKEPHDELYPCAFENEKISSKIIKILKDHVLNVIKRNFKEPDSFIYFTVFGSGASYNWDEDGDFDIQMWIDFDEFQKGNNEEITQDDLLAAIRRDVQTVNFPSFAELGLATDDCEGAMLIQYYPKPGKGTPEENLASKPYACYDLEMGKWLEKPKPIGPQFYGQGFLMVYPKAEDMAVQAEAILSELERHIVDWQFWFQMYSKYKVEAYKSEYEDAQKKAELEREGVMNMFLNVFQGRQKAYSPEGQGMNDEGDMVEKLLEVWGIFQRLKHYARALFPWEEQKLPEENITAEITTSGWNRSIESDYNGWTNWDTWHVKLMIDNEQSLYNYSRQLVEHGTVKDLADWALVKIMGPANKQQIEEYQEWNDLSDEERLEIEKENNPGIPEELLNYEQQTPQYIMYDTEVNWQEIYDSIKEDIAEGYGHQSKWTSIFKQADWGEITDKAKRYLVDGRVDITNFMRDPQTNQIHINATVDSETTEGNKYDVEIWKDDPNSNAITLWNCNCEWGQKSWGRTRQWKKYEGRPCVHVLATQWASQSQQPQDEGGDEQMQMPGMEEENLQPEVPMAPTPGGPNMPAAPTTPPIPTQPATPEPEQLMLPVELPPPSHLKGPNELGTLETPGTFSKIITSFFNNGEIVKTRQPLFGQDDRETDYIVPQGMAGEVLYSDGDTTIAIFSIESGLLGPHLVRVEDNTNLFYLAPGNYPHIKKRR